MLDPLMLRSMNLELQKMSSAREEFAAGRMPSLADFEVDRARKASHTPGEMQARSVSGVQPRSRPNTGAVTGAAIPSAKARAGGGSLTGAHTPVAKARRAPTPVSGTQPTMQAPAMGAHTAPPASGVHPKAPASSQAAGASKGLLGGMSRNQKMVGGALAGAAVLGGGALLYNRYRNRKRAQQGAEA